MDLFDLAESAGSNDRVSPAGQGYRGSGRNPPGDECAHCEDRQPLPGHHWDRLPVIG